MIIWGLTKVFIIFISLFANCFSCSSFISEKSKEISESESTIDNVNANNDISISLDLKINQKYDDKILNKNAGFVIGKNGKNDEELLRMMKYMKPINTAYIYQNNKKKIKDKLYIFGLYQ